MACACSKKKTNEQNQTYRWTSSDGSITQVFGSEIEAAAKVQRSGGSFVPQAA